MIDGKYSLTVKGEGEPLLMLHGYLSCKESFYYQIEALSRGRRVVAVDLPGFGGAAEPQYPFALKDYTDFVEGVILDECGGRADILAHSFGGRIALRLASQNGGLVGKMLLTGCAGLKPRRTARYYAKTLTYKALKRLAPTVAQKNISKFASSDYLKLSPLMKESFKLIVNEHLDGLLCKITVPTLLVFGRDDTETPLYMAKRLNAKIVDSGLVVMDGGHFCFAESPAYFNAVAEEFFF